MKIHYVAQIEGSRIVQFVAHAWCALMKEGVWSKDSVLVSYDLQCVYAVVGRQIAGCLTFRVTDGEAIVNIAYVRPAHRGQGIYRALHEEFVTQAKLQGATCALNICYPSNLAIQETCAKLGYSPYLLHLKLPL